MPRPLRTAFIEIISFTAAPWNWPPPAPACLPPRTSCMQVCPGPGRQTAASPGQTLPAPHLQLCFTWSPLRSLWSPASPSPSAPDFSSRLLEPEHSGRSGFQTCKPLCSHSQEAQTLPGLQGAALGGGRRRGVLAGDQQGAEAPRHRGPGPPASPVPPPRTLSLPSLRHLPEASQEMWRRQRHQPAFAQRFSGYGRLARPRAVLRAARRGDAAVPDEGPEPKEALRCAGG